MHKSISIGLSYASSIFIFQSLLTLWIELDSVLFSSSDRDQLFQVQHQMDNNLDSINIYASLHISVMLIPSHFFHCWTPFPGVN